MKVYSRRGENSRKIVFTGINGFPNDALLIKVNETLNQVGFLIYGRVSLKKITCEYDNITERALACSPNIEEYVINVMLTKVAESYHKEHAVFHMLKHNDKLFNFCGYDIRKLGSWLKDPFTLGRCYAGPKFFWFPYDRSAVINGMQPTVISYCSDNSFYCYVGHMANVRSYYGGVKITGHSSLGRALNSISGIIQPIIRKDHHGVASAIHGARCGFNTLAIEASKHYNVSHQQIDTIDVRGIDYVGRKSFIDKFEISE